MLMSGWNAAKQRANFSNNPTARQIWDANHLDVVGHFQLESRVYTVAMSPVATAHCLISAAGTDPQVRCCPVMQCTWGAVAAEGTLFIRWLAGEALRRCKRRLHAHARGPQRAGVGCLLVAHVRVAPRHRRMRWPGARRTALLL